MIYLLLQTEHAIISFIEGTQISTYELLTFGRKTDKFMVKVDHLVYGLLIGQVPPRRGFFSFLHLISLFVSQLFVPALHAKFHSWPQAFVFIASLIRLRERNFRIEGIRHGFAETS